ncbi:drug/metabolite transporter (DMT)-like permease [Lewinella marina]|uniref:Uncharacterized protein n=1 Tax=Neolewinella marina TaxID=438751 RepID=A0A2G0CFN7_9BACT|nr:hypothetical protein [Neolewinella marina]NJB85516.1 drug/metabolite transporter (DMT)-like permease [Neolewinella marina]PHK98795.1 hypothetical protein CGL56_10050 [Neolewinella marina]
MTSQTSIFERRVDPVLQAAVVLAMVFVVDMFGLIISGAGEEGEAGSRFPWLTAASFMLFFALFNAVLSASAPNTAKYWGRSIYSFMGLALGAGLLAWAFSGITISDAGSYRWIYIVVSVGYLVFLGMISLIKNVVSFAQREEWTRPRLKNRQRED